MAASSTGKRRPRKSSRTTKDTRKDQGLHLPSLHISGFRGIDELHIPKLGRVTLIAGDNSVGKTTVLEAVQLYALRGDLLALADTLRAREELYDEWDRIGPTTYVEWPSLFYGRDTAKRNTLEIGADDTEDESKRLGIQVVAAESPDGDGIQQHSMSAGPRPLGINVTFNGTTESFAVEKLKYPETFGSVRRVERQEASEDRVPGIPCEFLSSGPPRSYENAFHWNEIVLHGNDTRAVHALEAIVGFEVERVEIRGEDALEGIPADMRSHMADVISPSLHGQRVIVKVKGDERPLPLKSLGDGATRLFTLAMVLEKARDGFLLIDEAENGIHYSHHETYWKMVIETAIKNNIQVLATTHSFDCIAGFSRAVNSVRGDYGMLIRLDRGEDGKLSVAEYNEELLQITDEMGIEVR